MGVVGGLGLGSHVFGMDRSLTLSLSLSPSAWDGERRLFQDSTRFIVGAGLEPDAGRDS